MRTALSTQSVGGDLRCGEHAAVRLQHLSGSVLIVAVGAFCAGCARSMPPEVPEFKPPAVRTVAVAAPAEKTQSPMLAVEVAVTPPPEAPKATPRAVVSSAPAKPVEVPKVEAAKAPSIVGTWQVIEMSHGGKAQQMPPGMTMTFTFAEGGGLSMGMSGAPGAEAGAQQGTYSVSGSQITIIMRNESKTGSLAFEGNDRAIIDVDEAKMTLSRSSG